MAAPVVADGGKDFPVVVERQRCLLTYPLGWLEDARNQILKSFNFAHRAFFCRTTRKLAVYVEGTGGFRFGGSDGYTH